MTTNRSFKKAVRARMAETGEKYMSAREAMDGATGAAGLAPRSQLERYVELGYPGLCGMSVEAFGEWLEPLVDPAAEDIFDAETGRIGTVLVIRTALIKAEEAMARVEVGGKGGFVDMNPSVPESFSEIEAVETPDADAYLLHDFDPGDDLRNVPPSEALTRITDAGRSPVTIDEALAAVVLHPRLVADKHAFSILASRSAEQRVAKSVPAIWISKGAPRLGWCWDNNPHTWLGSASCSGTSAPPTG